MHSHSCLSTVVRSVHGEESTDPDSHPDLMRGSVVQWPAPGKRTTCLWRQMQQIGGHPLDERHAFLLGQVTTTRLI